VGHEETGVQHDGSHRFHVKTAPRRRKPGHTTRIAERLASRTMHPRVTHIMLDVILHVHSRDIRKSCKIVHFTSRSQFSIFPDFSHFPAFIWSFLVFSGIFWRNFPDFFFESTAGRCAFHHPRLSIPTPPTLALLNFSHIKSSVFARVFR